MKNTRIIKRVLVLVFGIMLITIGVTKGRESQAIEPKDLQTIYHELRDTMQEAMSTLESRSYHITDKDYKAVLGSAQELNRLKAKAYIEAMYDEDTWECDTLLTKARYIDKSTIEITFEPLAPMLSPTHYQTLREDLEELLLINDVYSLKDDASKVEWVYKYTLAHCSYLPEVDYGQNGILPNNAYVAFYEGKTQCRGYASLVKEFLDILGIENRIVSGFRYEYSLEEAPKNTDFFSKIHAWNIVKVDGKWYHLDATIGDNVGRENPEEFVLFGNQKAEGMWHWNQTKYPDISEEKYK